MVCVACAAPSGPDAGDGVDAAVPVACDSPEDCRVAGLDMACRQGVCTAATPCADDLECGLAESCVAGQCRFSGCLADAECPSGHCRSGTFDCAECGSDDECPFNRPVCQQSTNTCVACSDDSQCPAPGPGHCEPTSGACVHCLSDKHCPVGLTCSNNLCVGAGLNGSCDPGVSCAQGLTCVNVSGANICLPGCNLYAPGCAQGETCYALAYSGSTALVFEDGAPLGVCFMSQTGASYRSECVGDLSQSNCQANLRCVSESSSKSRCRTFCDPGASVNPCPSPEICHSFPGDYTGRRYGLCYDDNGYGDVCVKDGACRTGQTCQPAEDLGASELVSTRCQFNVGAAAGMAPCVGLLRPDGGALPPDEACASGQCVAEQVSPGTAYCFASCRTDADCSLGGRTGTCDGTFSVDVADVSASLRGCRPSCTREAQCLAYSLGSTCRARYSEGNSPSLSFTCQNAAGTLGAGAACVSSTDCRSGFCLFRDSRGVARHGTCVEACQSAADCASSPDAGVASGPLDCQATALLGTLGADGISGTADDRFAVASVCSGIACTSDEACGAAFCVPQVSGANTASVVLACRPGTGGLTLGGSPCNNDGECNSGACLAVANPDGGASSKMCFRACDGNSSCPNGTSCRATVSVRAPGGPVTVSGCVP